MTCICMNVRLYVCVVCMYVCMNVALFVCKIYILGNGLSYLELFLFFNRRVQMGEHMYHKCHSFRCTEGSWDLWSQTEWGTEQIPQMEVVRQGRAVILSDVESQKLLKVRRRRLTGHN